MLVKVLWEMLIFTRYGIKVYRDSRKLICNCFYVFMYVRGNTTKTETQALTFVYAFPPLSSCRGKQEDSNEPSDPNDPTLYYRGLQLQGCNERAEITGWDHTHGSSEHGTEAALSWWETSHQVCTEISSYVHFCENVSKLLYTFLCV